MTEWYGNGMPQQHWEELLKIEDEISAEMEKGKEKAIMAMGLPTIHLSKVGAKVEELRKKANEIAGRYGPVSFTIQVGFPFGASVSFTWSESGRAEFPFR